MLLTADTSVVVPSLTAWHEDHEIALAAVQEVRVLPAHVLLESASVLSRLPRGLAQPLSLVADILAESFPDEPLTLPGDDHRSVLRSLADLGVRGGAIYDGLVAATADHHGARLLSLDVRAAPVYRHLAAAVHWLR